MVWAWTMPARHPEPDREGCARRRFGGVLDALDPMPVAARNPWCGVSRLPVSLDSRRTIDRRSCQPAPRTRRSLMRGLQLPRSRSAHRPSRPYRYVVSLLATLGVLVVPTVASAATGFREEVASARSLISFQCPDGTTAADGRLIVETDNFIGGGTTRAPTPPLGVGLGGQCRDGTPLGWGFVQPA